eukprot:CAMPEP_0185558762 /NCGR_PEP_ID=MMETSP1381-20130426/52939_1 /TAXON_ID=298111 /ORGANISM="Pavlova sp., Strain CCMP459" /LENGTH=434 /DNA_ID=CAMNT_0028172333 /DNA_START=23 /DNA_END=1324 /DNA_ORIENTATION=+
MADDEVDPFDHGIPPREEAPPVPPTPVIGTFRKNATNSIIVKDELGKCRQTTYNLPGPEHTYGKALFREDEGTGEMIMSWMEHKPNPHAKPGRDFKALNKRAVVSGAATAKAQTDFRKTHDARLKMGTHEDRKFTLADDFVHGKHTRPSTPIRELISSAYRWSWVADHLEEEAMSTSPLSTRRSAKPASTKASRGHASGALQKSQSLAAAQESVVENKPFTMKRFQKVPAKVTKFLPPAAGKTTGNVTFAPEATTAEMASPEPAAAVLAEPEPAQAVEMPQHLEGHTPLRVVGSAPCKDAVDGGRRNMLPASAHEGRQRRDAQIAQGSGFADYRPQSTHPRYHINHHGSCSLRCAHPGPGHQRAAARARAAPAASAVAVHARPAAALRERGGGRWRADATGRTATGQGALAPSNERDASSGARWTFSAVMIAQC